MGKAFSLLVRANATGRGSHPPERDRVRAPNEPRALSARRSAALFIEADRQGGNSAMEPTAAYLVALALTLLILVVLWEGLS
jgi:hypothetical protein